MDTRRLAGGVGAFAITLVVFGAVALMVAGAAPSRWRPAADGVGAPPGDARPTDGGSEDVVTLAFGGDVHLEGWLADRWRSEGHRMLEPLRPLLGDADVAVVNLETAVADGAGAPEAKQYVFDAPAELLAGLASVGVDVGVLANNHALDRGPGGLLATVEAAQQADLDVVGAGIDERAAWAPVLVDVADTTVAILAATQVLDDAIAARWTAGPSKPGVASARALERLVDAVADARGRADVVVVYLHWGIERASCPSVPQRWLSDRLAEAGADVVVGSHAHRLQAAGHKGGAFVAYGLGNAVWYAADGPATDAGVLHLTMRGRRVASSEWRPARLTDGVATSLTGPEAAAAQAAWGDLASCADVAPGPAD